VPGTNRAEALRQKLEERSAQVAVVGLGYVGLPLALALTQAGFRVIGIDAAASKVEAINRGVSHIEDVASDEVSRAIAAGRLRATTDSADAAAADVAIIAVPTPIDEFRVPDLSHVRSATAALAAAMKPGSLVVLESTTYPGTTEEVLMPAFVERGFTPGEDLFVGYSPERIDPGNQRWNLHNTPKVVCGLTKTCLELVVQLYSSFVETLVPVSSLKTAEITKLFENIFRGVNIALVNEFQVICDAFGIDVWEVIAACATKPYGFMTFYPGPGLGGHCVPVDPFYLAWKARERSVNTEFIELSGRVNAAMPSYISGKVGKLLNSRHKSLNGARVGLLLEPSLPFYGALFGTLKRGAVAVPLFTLFGPDALAPRLADSGARLLLVGADVEPAHYAARGVEVLRADAALEARLAAESDRYAPATAPDDLAVLQYTSGTTRALPEAVRHTHRAVVTLMIAAIYGLGLTPDDRYFCPSSPAWGHGLWHGTISPLALGLAAGAYSGRFDALRLREALSAFRITNLAAAPTVYRLLRESGLAGREGLHLTKLTYTGEPMDEATWDWIEAMLGLTPCGIYGSTEVGVIVVNYPGFEGYRVRRGALGKPAPGWDVAVVDPETRRPLPPGEVGEIAVRRKGEWFLVKDRGTLDADGYLHHGGRSDDVIISAGWTLSALEIERALLSHPDVREAAVVGVADARRGQVPQAWVVSRRRSPSLAAELQDHVRAGIFEREMTEIDAGIGSDANRASVLELNFRPAVGLRRKFHALDHGHVERCFFETLSGSPVNRNGTLDFTQANDAHMGFRESGNHGECEPDHQSKPRAQASVPHKLSPGDSVPLPH